MICLSCGKREFTSYLDKINSSYDRENNFSLLKCNYCCLIITSPTPEAKYLEELYKNIYGYRFHQLFSKEKSKRAEALAKYIKIHAGKKQNVVEFGTGDGSLLKKLELLKFTVRGVEIDKNSCLLANEKLTTGNVVNQSIENFLNSDNGLEDEIYIFSHSLEHMLDPKNAILQIKNKGKEDSLLVITLPNYDRSYPGILKRYWGYWQVPVHITHFNYESMQTFLELCGFKIIDVKYRNSDFMTIGSSISNLFQISGEGINPNKISQFLLKFVSNKFNFLSNFGKQEMTVVAKKIENQYPV
jgi:2-polyprenyl-3-methyl-5-hydroxy-6-metoxy-1,4-benzoquinol methylase